MIKEQIEKWIDGNKYKAFSTLPGAELEIVTVDDLKKFLESLNLNGLVSKEEIKQKLYDEIKMAEMPGDEPRDEIADVFNQNLMDSLNKVLA